MQRARLILTAIWWGWGLILFVVLGLLSTRLDATQAWGWFLPNILPIMTMVGTAAYLTTEPRRSRGVAAGTRAPLLLLSILTSLAYLAMLSGSVLSPLWQGEPIKFMVTSNLWLTPMQLLATTTLGAFFVQQRGAAPEA